MDDLRAAVKANITVTSDIIATDKDRVGVDVAWKQESVNDPHHYIGIQYTFNLRVGIFILTHIYEYARIQASPAASPTHNHIVQ